MSNFRRNWLTRPIYSLARKALPPMSDTEREALEAGDTWWDADLFTGKPDWAKLLATPQAKLSDEEQAFLAGPVDQLCAMLDDWQINFELHDLPPEVWTFIKANGFFGMIIPKEFGGLGFSNFAHSEVVRRISTRSIAAAVTVMVPNSLGPGELLMKFGTREQQEYWLPRLASGREIPCFGLTSPEAGSDAAAMTDVGIICRGQYQGRETLGIRLNWHKRYITLGPIATVLGLAFKARDPDRLLGDEEDLGITVALVPTNTPGVEIGRRHLPSFQVFQNGPNSGHDVFLPLDHIIGGPARIGQGWKMLMAALAAGRGISLPSLSAAGAAFAARTTGAYARVREQFNIPIAKFEGVAACLARIAGTAYLLDAARRMTCAALDMGHHPAVISGIMKLHATERMRTVVNDAMDVHAGKAVIDGPRNYLGNLYRAIPIGITVEGANILTRNLIIFGQGAVRAHPYLLEEFMSLGDTDSQRGLDRFDKVFWKHVGHSLKNMGRALGHGWTRGMFASAPETGKATRYYRQLSRYSAAFAFTADIALLTLGGALKRREMLSARLGDILSELYLLSAALKRWEDEGRQPADLPALRWCMHTGFQTIETRFAEVFANLPNRPAGWLLSLFILPFGARDTGPGDYIVTACADMITTPSEARDRLTPGLYLGSGNEPLAQLERAFDLVNQTDPIMRKVRQAKLRDWREAVTQCIITTSEGELLEATHEAVARVINVDDFAPEELTQSARRLAQASMKAAV
jgi:acyl-CoA dehydrogenase